MKNKSVFIIQNVESWKYAVGQDSRKLTYSWIGYEELITLIVQVVHNQQKELDDIRDNIAELNQKLENLK